jgi:hypothetical protein|tara:strand:- start:307 stop:507 length:201 start_codon:yes stop_codon:yes gene_type:complete
MRQKLIDALKAKYKSDISGGEATLHIYLTNPVGIGEHPQHLEECDKQVEKIATAKEKLAVLEDLLY